jgi:hypothetical protein
LSRNSHMVVPGGFVSGFLVYNHPQAIYYQNSVCLSCIFRGKIRKFVNWWMLLCGFWCTHLCPKGRFARILKICWPWAVDSSIICVRKLRFKKMAI